MDTVGVRVPVDFIWFDLGYTLLYKERERLFGEVLGWFHIDRSFDDLERAFHLTDKRFMRDYPGFLGRPPEEFMPLYIGFLCRQLNVRGDLVAVLNRWMDAWQTTGIDWLPYPYVTEVLGCLAAKGLRLGVISNWDPSAKAILARCGLMDFFEVVIISSEVGVCKPEERIFRIALEQARVDPTRCLSVGDNFYDDTVGARTVGMKSLIINRFGSLGVEELAGQENGAPELIADISGILPRLGDA